MKLTARSSTGKDTDKINDPVVRLEHTIKYENFDFNYPINDFIYLVELFQ